MDSFGGDLGADYCPDEAVNSPDLQSNGGVCSAGKFSKGYGLGVLAGSDSKGVACYTGIGSDWWTWAAVS